MGDANELDGQSFCKYGFISLPFTKVWVIRSNVLPVTNDVAIYGLVNFTQLVRRTLSLQLETQWR